MTQRSTAAAVRELLGEAIGLCPALGQARVETVWAGLRPGSIDTKPYIGLAPGFRNLIVATGHKCAGLAALAGDSRAGLRTPPGPEAPA